MVKTDPKILIHLVQMEVLIGFFNWLSEIYLHQGKREGRLLYIAYVYYSGFPKQMLDFPSKILKTACNHT